MEAQFEMLPEDLAAFKRYWGKQWTWRRLLLPRTFLIVLIGVAQLAAIRWVLLRYLDEPDYSQALCMLSGVQVICWIAVLLILTKNANTYKRQFKGEKKQIHVLIDAERLHYSNPDTTESRRWKGLEKVGVTDDYTFFFTRADAAYILPRRAFAEREEYHKFVETARRYFDVAKAFGDNPYDDEAP